jgi:hypothetical protein
MNLLTLPRMCVCVSEKKRSTKRIHACQATNFGRGDQKHKPLMMLHVVIRPDRPSLSLSIYIYIYIYIYR